MTRARPSPDAQRTSCTAPSLVNPPAHRPHLRHGGRGGRPRLRGAGPREEVQLRRVRAEDWSGSIITILTIVGLALGIPGAVLTKLTVSGRRQADQGRPGTLHSVATAAIVIAGCCALLMSTGGFTSAFAVGLAFCGLYALPAVLVLQATHAGSEPPPDDRDHTGVTAT